MNPPTINLRPHSNLTKLERIALKKLKHNTSISIKRADKGSVIVIEDKTTYILEGRKHLDDPSTY